jgi:tellurite resistance protein TerC
MRAGFIFVGVGLIRRFHWIVYAFGGLLIYSGFRLPFQHGTQLEPDRNVAVRVFRRFVPLAPTYAEGKFFLRRGEQLYATPLLLVLIIIETTDVMFAVDSIPAVLAITLNTFIVYTSNIFAILGLRSLFFVLSPLMDAFQFLYYGIACVLVFVGVKILLSDYYPIPTEDSLAVIVAILITAILASALHRRGTART